MHRCHSKGEKERKMNQESSNDLIKDNKVESIEDFEEEGHEGHGDSDCWYEEILNESLEGNENDEPEVDEHMGIQTPINQSSVKLIIENDEIGELNQSLSPEDELQMPLQDTSSPVSSLSSDSDSAILMERLLQIFLGTAQKKWEKEYASQEDTVIYPVTMNVGTVVITVNRKPTNWEIISRTRELPLILTFEWGEIIG